MNKLKKKKSNLNFSTQHGEACRHNLGVFTNGGSGKVLANKRYNRQRT
jgi:hypothetical protein